MTRPTPHVAAVVLALLVATLPGVSRADTDTHGTPTFLAPIAVFDHTATSAGSAAMSYDGTLALARVTADGALQAQIRRPGEPPARITTLQPVGAAMPIGVQVVAAHVPFTQSRRQGPIAVVWDDGTGESRYAFAHGYGWSAPVSLGTDPVLPQAVAMGEDGRLWVAQRHGTDTHLTVALRGEEPRVLTLPHGPRATDVDVALDVPDSGRPLVAVVRSSGTPVTTDGDPCTIRTHLALLTVLADGTTSVAQSRDPQEATGTVSGGACRPTSGAILTSPRLRSSYADSLATYAVMAADGQGRQQIRAVARDQRHWDRFTTPIARGTAGPLFVGDDFIQVVTWVDDSGLPQLGYVRIPDFGPHRRVSLASPQGGADALGDGGYAGGVLAWRDATAPFAVHYRAFDDVPTEGPTVTSTATGLVGVGVDRNGNGAVVTTDAAGTTTQAVPLDASGPDLAVPGRPHRIREYSFPDAKVGVPATFSVLPLDVWSGVREAQWRIDDGPWIDGDEITPTFDHEDTYDLEVRAVDDLGHRTESSTVVEATDGVPPRIEHLRLRRDADGYLVLHLRVADFDHMDVTAYRRGHDPIDLFDGLFPQPPDDRRTRIGLGRLAPGRYRIVCVFHDLDGLRSRATLPYRVPDDGAPE